MFENNKTQNQSLFLQRWVTKFENFSTKILGFFKKSEFVNPKPDMFIVLIVLEFSTVDSNSIGLQRLESSTIVRLSELITILHPVNAFVKCAQV